VAVGSCNVIAIPVMRETRRPNDPPRDHRGMARSGQAKHRVSRRFGVDVHGTGGASLARRLQTPPGGARAGRRRKTSEYGAQLTEKQKLKAIYGLDEGALRRQLEASTAEEGPTGENLLERLERRLDNTVYRLGFARSRPMARQLVSHGHVLIDGHRATIASIVVDPGQRIELTPGAFAIPGVTAALADGRPVPEWLERETSAIGRNGARGPDPVTVAGRVRRLPTRDDAEQPVDERLVVEFYRR
jgi:small subunit ribosomal protein S4